MIESYPTSVLIDPDGVIVSMDSGTQGLKDVEKVIEKIFENDDNHLNGTYNTAFFSTVRVRRHPYSAPLPA